MLSASVEKIHPAHQGRRVEMRIAHNRTELEQFFLNVKAIRQAHTKNPDRHFSFFHPQWSGACYALYANGDQRSIYVVKYSENKTVIEHYDMRFLRKSFEENLIKTILPDATFDDVSRNEQTGATFHKNQKEPLSGDFNEVSFLERAAADALQRIDQFTESQRHALHL